MRFVPHKKEDTQEMLKVAGVKSASELFVDIPKNVLIEKELELSPPLNERELRTQVEAIAAKNKTVKQLSLFLGAGCYNHFIPATVPALVGRSEFYTSYTPYQPETSQGMLQAIYEWQTYVCMLTGMDIANASVYDGASATAEAMMMAKGITGRKKVLVTKGLNPEYKAVVETYANTNGLQLKEIEANNAEKEVDKETACLIIQQPDFFGRIKELKSVEKAVHAKDALLIVSIAEAMSFAFIGQPGKEGADIVAAEMQSLGNSMSYGGPHAGVIACRQKFMRQIPGRLVGKTVDTEGKQGFVLTLQAREQHIRRERAGSNICTNQALCALAVTVYLSTVGEKGLQEIAAENNENAEYLHKKLKALKLEFPFEENFFNEFTVKVKNAKQVQEKLLEKGTIFGYALEEKFPELKDCLIVAATEMNTKKEIDSLAKQLEAIL